MAEKITKKTEAALEVKETPVRYRVIRAFKDLKDDKYEYAHGDTYPREGLEPHTNRIKALESNENSTKAPLIKRID